MKQFILPCMIFIVFFCQEKSFEKNHGSFYPRSTAYHNQDSDTICYRDKNIVLDINKEEGFLNLNYSFTYDKKPHTLKMRYFDYSDVIFSGEGIGVVDTNTFTSKKIFIKDTILFISIPANANSQSIYIVDLKKEEVISDDIRTSLNFLWINQTGTEFLLAESRVYKDSISQYKINKFKIGSKIKLMSSKRLTLKNDSIDNIDYEFKKIKNFFN